MEPSSGNSEITSAEPGVGWRPRLGGVFAAGVAVVLVAGGCSSDPGEEPSGPVSVTTPEEVEATPAEPTPADEAKAALEAYLEFRDDAYRKAEVDLEELAEVATGDQFLSIQAYVAENIQMPGLEFVGEYVHNIQEPTRRKDGFEIVVCQDSSGVQRLRDGEDVGPTRTRDGDPIPDVVAYVYTLVEQDGSWLVEESTGNLELPC